MALGTYPAVNRAFFDVDVEIRSNAGQRDSRTSSPPDSGGLFCVAGFFGDGIPCGYVAGPGGDPLPGFAARFLEQAQVLDAHAAVDRLAHIVNGQQANRGCGQRLHFDAGPAMALGGYTAGGTFRFCIELLDLVHLGWTEFGQSIAREAAMRRGEILTLTWKSVDLARRTAFRRFQSMDASGQYPQQEGDRGLVGSSPIY